MDEAGSDGWNIQRGKGSCKINKVVVSSAHLYIFILYQSPTHSAYFSIFFLFLKPRPFLAIGPLHPLFRLLACSLRGLFLFILQVLPPQKSLFDHFVWSWLLPMTFSHQFINFFVEIYQPPQIDCVFNYLFICLFSPLFPPSHLCDQGPYYSISILFPQYPEQ